jgi:nucleotide sugar dehydrogenase
MKKICVVGLGYVGLTLGIVLADVGFNVIGVEKNEETVTLLNKGVSHIYEPHIDFLLKKHLNHNLAIVNSIPVDKDIDTYIICVATPIDEYKKPNLNYVRGAMTDVIKHLKKNDLIILRSTVPVGTSRNVVNEILKKNSKSDISEISLVFAPERTLEGKALEELRYLPQIIGGLDENSVNKAINILVRVTNTIVRVSSIEAAELIKQIDNIYRDVNIALGNELGMACELLGLDAFEIISSANMNYPRNRIMVPGSGVGGACLTKDPYLFLSQLDNIPENSIIFRSRKINEGMPGHVVSLAENALLLNKKNLIGARVAVLGFAFKGKPETADARFSPTLDLLKILKNKGANVVVMDPVVPKDVIKNEAEYASTYELAFQNTDCVIIMNNHPKWSEMDFDMYKKYLKPKAAVIDGWKMLNRSDVEKAGFVYRCVGVG